MTVDVLGTKYELYIRTYQAEPSFEREHVNGYLNEHTKTICVCDMSTYPTWEFESELARKAAQKEALRHEIVHAFLAESGLQDCSNHLNLPWAKNEEMVDWIAIQGPKIYKAWQEAGAL